MPVEAFVVSVVDSTAEALVTVSGELDASNCPELASRLRPVTANGVSDVDIDLSHVTFADSAVVDLLTQVSLDLLANGRRLRVIDPSEPILRLLTLTDLSVWFSPRE